MVHRGIPEHGSWWRLGRDMLWLAVLAGAGSVVFILGDLVIYGRVNW
jgi:hypothetical protein